MGDRCTFFIGDDGGGKAFQDQPSSLEIFDRYNKDCRIGLSYGDRVGISGNKNRVIHEFLLDTSYQYLILMDDDQVFIAPGLVEELIKVLELNQLNHVTGQWNSGVPEIQQLTGGSWTDIFSVEAEGKYNVTWHINGSHGNCHFYSRKCIEKIGYWPILPHKYGYDHALHTSLAMLVCDHRSPTFHPQHREAYLYYSGRSDLPNNYSIEDVHANSDEYKKIMVDIFLGKIRKNKSPGIDLTKQTVVRSFL